MDTAVCHHRGGLGAVRGHSSGLRCLRETGSLEWWWSETAFSLAVLRRPGFTVACSLLTIRPRSAILLTHVIQCLLHTYKTRHVATSSLMDCVCGMTCVCNESVHKRNTASTVTHTRRTLYLSRATLERKGIRVSLSSILFMLQ